MEIKGYMASQAIRYVAPVEQKRPPRSPVPLIRGFQDKYGFIQVPRTLAEWDFKNGVSFLRGYYKEAVIDKLQIYENGLLCELKDNNEIADEFLDEIIHWAEAELDLPIQQSGVRAYLSQMEIITPPAVAKLFPSLSTVGKMIAGSLEKYGQPTDAFHINGFRMHYDSAIKPVPRAPEFIFERRAGEPYSANLFFTSAPLRTEDHKKVIALLEDAFR